MYATAYPQKIPNVEVLGTPLAATDYASLANWLAARAGDESAGALSVDFANTQIVAMRCRDDDFRHLSDTAMDVFCPDGMPLVWCMNRRGARLADRVYGPAFTRYFFGQSSSSTTHYLVGGSEYCGQLLREKMTALNPAIRFVGGFHGDCSPEGILDEDERVTAEILSLAPDFIWVGLGTPKQYRWIARIKPLLRRGTLLAVGFAFDVNAGTKPDAPAWMQRLGLTWLYRLATEPSRLLPRYIKWNSLFLWSLLMGCQPSEKKSNS